MVFSDLDGSLLDHFSYSYEAALPLIDALEHLGIPLILASSKTKAEMLALRDVLHNKHPFIIENGAAVCIPRDYFTDNAEKTTLQGQYRVHEMAPRRERWLTALADLRKEFAGQFLSFHTAGTAGIVEMTGLTEQQAEAAGARGYSEPVQWMGTPRGERQFAQRLRESGATVTRGGRFLTVTGDCDKGRAMAWLLNIYRQRYPGECIEELAVGDSDNDRPMLEVARTALLIRSPVHDYPTLHKNRDVLHSEKYAPAGWTEGVSRWLQRHGIVI
ncbi:MAG: HAD-IIB family hydrolase [Halioglobus sp.]|nr:HAD-IIB family hydrolase [Halioglobus sp.]